MLQFDTSLSDLDHHAKTQMHGKAKTNVLIFSQISQSVLIKISVLPIPSLFGEAHALFSQSIF